MLEPRFCQASDNEREGGKTQRAQVDNIGKTLPNCNSVVTLVCRSAQKLRVPSRAGGLRDGLAVMSPLTVTELGGEASPEFGLPQGECAAALSALPKSADSGGSSAAGFLP